MVWFVSHIEQVLLSVKDITTNAVMREIFLEFVQTENTRGISLAKLFVKRILAWKMEKENMRAQTSKGSDMGTKFNGVMAERITKFRVFRMSSAWLEHAIIHCCILTSFQPLNQSE